MQTMISTLRLGAATLLAALLAGCAAPVITGGADVEKAAFGDKKRFAIVTIASSKNFSGERALLDTFKSADSVAGANSQPIIDRLSPRIVSTLGQTRHFILVPESRVLANRAYKVAAEDVRQQGAAIFTTDLNVAQGYRYFSEPQKYARLAQDLGVDGVIAVYVHFGVTATNMGGAIKGIALGAKRYSASASASAIAYNQKGEVIWKDQTHKEADAEDTRAVVVLDTSMFTGADFVKMQPSAVEIGGKAIEVLVSRLDDTLAGRSVDRVQWTK